jgi:transposase
LHLILDKGASHIAQETKAYLASHPRLRAFYTPPHASWLNQAELLLRAFADRDLQRVDSQSRQHLIDHLEASWPEYNRRFGPPFPGSWNCCDLYAWARKKGTAICTKTYATIH